MNQPRRIQIHVEQTSVGNDRLFLVTGGKAHIGAVATGFWSDEGVKVKTTIVPGHKEGPLAETFARHAASAFRCTVTVIMGIHIDNATKEEIRYIENEVERLMKLAVLQSGRTGV